MLIKKYVKITIQGNTSMVDDNLYFYKNDKNIDVMFELINFKFDFIKNQAVGENTVVKTNASYATLRIIKPNGEKMLIIRCPIEDYYVKFTVTPEFIDDLEEVGIHQLQITLYDEFEGRISIPPISFEVLQPLFDDDESWYDEGQVNLTKTNIVTMTDEEWINDLNGRPEITEGTNLFEWKHGDWISDIRLNAIHDNIVKLNNKIYNLQNDLEDMIKNENEEEDMVLPIKGGRIATTIKNEEILTDGSLLTQVTIFNETDEEIHIIVNLGEEIPLEAEESLSFGDIIIYSIIIVENGSIIKYIGY